MHAGLMAMLGHDALAVLRAALPGVEVRLRRMRRSLLSARRIGSRIVVTMHPELPIDPDHSVLISSWLAHRGAHGTTRRLQAWLEQVRRTRTTSAAVANCAWLEALPVIGPAPDLLARAALVHASAFADIDLPQVIWGRRPPARRLRHIRFGCYKRGVEPRIEISPRLARPWIASCFLDHVLHHEFCHHRQFRQRMARSEGVHSPRFRAWEKSFAGYEDALRWEGMALPWLLDDTPPPWYRQHGSNACTA